jgi:hypothetical protein
MLPILDFGFWIEKSLARGTFDVAICSQAKQKGCFALFVLRYFTPVANQITLLKSALVQLQGYLQGSKL